MDFVQQERDRLCDHVYLIQKDMRVSEHIGSHKVTMKAEDKIFNKYQYVYLELNKQLRTDRERIVHLQDNVPCLFKLEEKGRKAHFAFPMNFDLHPKGTILVVFESSTPVEVYLSSDKRKPDRDFC
jgi:hypothetical protein